MSKSWRDKAASEAASAILRDTMGDSSKKFELPPNEPFVSISEPLNPLQTCDCCQSKENIKAIGVGNKRYGENSRFVIHLCPEHMKMFGEKLLENCQ